MKDEGSNWRRRGTAARVVRDLAARGVERRDCGAEENARRVARRRANLGSIGQYNYLLGLGWEMLTF